jgi:hypothetical protein
MAWHDMALPSWTHFKITLPSFQSVFWPLARRADVYSLEDGKEMNLDLSNMRITEAMEQVDRHSRQLARKEELTGN